ncbi:MAG TPA: pitrilysin family protein [Gemmatimonadaceae bacterium]
MTRAHVTRAHVRSPAAAAALLALLALPAARAGAQEKEAPPAPGAPRDFVIPPAREITLPNGMGVTLVQYGTTPKVEVGLVLRMGNVNEKADQVWLADLTGDLLQEGTTTHSAEEINRAVADMGGSLDVGVAPDQTTIGGAVLGEFAPRMVRLVADVVRHPAFPDSELPRLRADRLRSLSVARSQPQSIALEKFLAVLYPDHPYGRLFPTPEMLQGYTVQQIRDFYAANAGAARAHLYVVGRFDEGAVEQAVREAFGDWRGATALAALPAPPAHAAAGDSAGWRMYVIDRPGAVQSSLYIGLHVPDPSSRDYIALQVMNALLGGAFSSRITSNIREAKGYTYSPFSQITTHYRDAYWAEIADVTTNVTGPSIKEILGEIERLRHDPPPDSELTGIQNYLAGTFVLRNSSRVGIENQLAFVRMHGLGDDWLSTYVKRVYAITPADVQRMAREYLDPDRMTIVVVGDRKVVDPQLRELRKREGPGVRGQGPGARE